ncbi:MAG: hypothetical protein JW969_01735 [Spirochaetales bacterium]|nr:hypothetical protein [Spirochaetales bacterium]
MKESPELKKARRKMTAGVITAEGFLGNDNRTLSDIIGNDEETMEALHLDWEKIAAVLRELLEKGLAGLGKQVEVGDLWTIVADDARGKLPCPFGDGMHKKQSILITDKSTGKKYLINDLTVHLIKAHHFLQGKGSSHRIEPADLKQFS